MPQLRGQRGTARRRAAAGRAIAGAVGILCAAAAVGAEPSRYGVLYEADGVAETYAFCTPCHSERIVAQQGLTREHWDDLLDWMIEEQGMVEIPEPIRTRILDYLAAHYGEDRPHFPVPQQ